MDYLASTAALWVNLVGALVFAPIAYDYFAKRWAACTGRYRADGHITYSEYHETGNYPYGGGEGCISYAYRVDGKLYTGLVPLSRVTVDSHRERYYRGAPITVYYAPRKPGFGWPDRPPSAIRIGWVTFGAYMGGPLVALNVIAWFVHYLATH